MIEKAIRFATIAHAGQKRKYTDEPYINHPKAVASLLLFGAYITDEDVLCAALLHDVIEDTSVTYQDITCLFNRKISEYVSYLTAVRSPEDGNRATRKAIDRKIISEAPQVVKSIKLADLIDNSLTILAYDKGFAKSFMAEMKLLLEVLKWGNLALFKKAQAIVDNYYKDN